jgi:hypothetical protein
LAFSTCPPWPCAASVEVARTCAGLPVRLHQGSGDLQPDPRDLRLSFGDAFRFARSVSIPGAGGVEVGARRPPCSSPLDPVRIGTSSLGVVNVRPSVDMPAQRPLPMMSWLRRASCWLDPRGVRASQDSGTTFGSKLPPFELVPPLPFLPASAVCSAGPVAGLLHPAADHGVRHVSGPMSASLGPSLEERGPRAR